MRRNEVPFTPVSRFPLLACKSKLGGFVPHFTAAEVDRRIDFAALNEISRFAVAAGRLALDHAGLKVGRANGEQVGIAMGVCNGPCEMGHMDRVFGTAKYEADLNSFSNITANSTAGWVSTSLCLKGENISLGTGPHAGLQAMAWAFDALGEKRSQAILAMAADEVYAQTFYNYDGIGFLYAGEDEQCYRLHRDEAKRKVLGEGAAGLLMESATAAAARGATVYGEMLGYGLSMDAGQFDQQNLDAEGLTRAVELALKRSCLDAQDIGLIVWAPQGNRQDLKMLEVAGKLFPNVPLATTTFHTGYIESASILVTLAAALSALHDGPTLWPERTGLSELDARGLTERPRHVLALGSTDIGYNFAVAVRLPGKA
jgi:3-oxoacyl-[acyl-carrier-protein] synthase II